MKPMVIIVNTGSKGGRETLESIEGHSFKDKNEVSAACKDLFDEGCFSVWSMTDFMDFYNNSDDEAPSDETLVVADTFFGYVYAQ